MTVLDHGRKKMDSKRFGQIEHLHHAALAHKPEERSVLLDQADPDVRREVEALLKQKSVGGIFDHRAADS